jgi:hypothetical protein
LKTLQSEVKGGKMEVFFKMAAVWLKPIAQALLIN